MNKLAKKDIINWFKAKDAIGLFSLADRTRFNYCRDEVHVRGIIEFSNYCKKDCIYCGLRKSNKSLQRYRMDENEIVNSAIKASKLGYKTIVLQSGEDEVYSIDSICSITKSIKRNVDCAITLSIGEKTFDEYRKLKESGTDRYLLKFETSDRKLYEKLKPDSSYDKRFTCLNNLKSLGYQTGSGNMVGLPGQTYKMLADDILLMRRLELDMIGIGPFLPHHNTPLYDAKPGTLDLTLRVLALTRIIIPYAHMPATTAVASLDTNGRQVALKCGANVIMPNITPFKYRKYYEIYPNKICIDEELSDCRFCIENMVKSFERHLSKGYGHSIKQKYTMSRAC